MPYSVILFDGQLAVAPSGELITNIQHAGVVPQAEFWYNKLLQNTFWSEGCCASTAQG